VAVDNTTEFHMSPQTLSRASLFPQKNRKLASSDSAASPAPSQKKKLTGFQRFQSFL
jgi:hypothetical protein